MGMINEKSSLFIHKEEAMYVVNPYLIQRGTINTPLAATTARLSQAVEFDYMGSAEFEFGALPKSFRVIEAVRNTWKCRIVKEIMEGDRPLRVYTAINDEDFGQYVEFLKAARKGKLHTKESTYFEEGRFETSRYLRADFWWDISNHSMFGFHKAFMNRLPHYVEASIAYMNEQKAAK